MLLSAPVAGTLALVLHAGLAQAAPAPADGGAIIIMPGFDEPAAAIPVSAPFIPAASDAGPTAADDPLGELVSGGDGPSSPSGAPAPQRASRKKKGRGKPGAQAPAQASVAAPAADLATTAPASAVDWLPGLRAPATVPAAAAAAGPAEAPKSETPRPASPRAAKAPRLALPGRAIRKLGGHDELAEPEVSAPSAVVDAADQSSATLATTPAPALTPTPAPTPVPELAMAPAATPATANDPDWAKPSEGGGWPTPPALAQSTSQEAGTAPGAAPASPPAPSPAPALALASTAGSSSTAPESAASDRAAKPGLSYPWAAPAPPPPPPAPVVETPAVDPEKLAKIDASPEVRAATMAVAAAPNLAVEFLPSTANTESLREAIVAALKGNPEIQIALARQDFARYGIHQANAALLPKVDLNMAIGGELNTPNAGDPTRLVRKEGSVTLNQNVFDFGATFNDIKRARADYRSAQWGTRERIEAIAYDITTAYLTVLQQQKLVALTQEKIASTEKIVKMVTVQNGLGLNTTADVSRAKARLENVQAELLDRQSALQQAREAYRRLTKRLPMTAIDLPSPGDALPASAEMAVDMIDSHNPRLAQAMEDRRSLDRQRAAQTGNLFPKFGITAQGNWKDDVAGATGVNQDARAMVTVTYNFLNGGAELAIRKRIEAKLREAEYEIDRRRREVEQDIRIDFTALEAARAKIATIDNEIAAAQKVDELYRQQFREGRRSVFDLLDSQQILFDAKASQIANGTARQLAEFRVLQRLGGLFDLVSQGEPLPDITRRAPGMTR